MLFLNRTNLRTCKNIGRIKGNQSEMVKHPGTIYQEQGVGTTLWRSTGEKRYLWLEKKVIGFGKSGKEEGEYILIYIVLIDPASNFH